MSKVSSILLAWHSDKLLLPDFRRHVEEQIYGALYDIIGKILSISPSVPSALSRAECLLRSSNYGPMESLSAFGAETSCLWT